MNTQPKRKKRVLSIVLNSLYSGVLLFGFLYAVIELPTEYDYDFLLTFKISYGVLILLTLASLLINWIHYISLRKKIPITKRFFIIRMLPPVGSFAGVTLMSLFYYLFGLFLYWLFS